jgi:Uma2 family endonuclease
MALTDRNLTSNPAHPNEETSLEYDDGLVTQKMAAQADHGSLRYQLSKRLDLTGEARALGKVFPETRFVTPGWSPVPDVSYHRRERLRLQGTRRFGTFNLVPDIAIEIVSPGQSLGEMLRKCMRYAGVGVSISLMVDPDDETVCDVRPDEPLRVLRGDDLIDLEPVFAGFDLTVRALFDSIIDDWLLEDATSEPAAE